MRLIRKIAVRCAVTGGILAVVTAGLKAFTTPRSVLAGTWWYLPVLGFVALMGLIAIVAVILRNRQFGWAKALMWISGLTIMLASVWIDVFVWAVFFFPTYMMLILSAIGLKPAPRTSGGGA